MLKTICPNCGDEALVSIGDGMYRCETCGYVGKANFNESVFKK